MVRVRLQKTEVMLVRGEENINQKARTEQRVQRVRAEEMVERAGIRLKDDVNGAQQEKVAMEIQICFRKFTQLISLNL